MTPRQRLLAAYTHEEVDRVPCSPRLHAWLADYYGKSGPDSFLQAAREFGFDPHFNYRAFCSAIVPGAGGLPGGLQDVSCEIDERTESGYRICRRTITTPAGVLTDETRYPPVSDRTYGVDPNPIRTEYLVKRREDLKALQYLIPRKSADDLKGYFEVERQFGEDGLVMLQVTSSLCHRAGDAVGVENLMILYYEDHAFFEAVIDIFRQEMMDEIDTALKAGVRHFFLNWYYNSLSSGWSPEVWRREFAPELRMACERIHAGGGTANFYDDGKCSALLEDFADAGIDVLQTLVPPPVGDVDLADAKRRIGARVCLMGHVDLIYVIQKGTPELIRDTVRKALEIAAPGGGFILGTSDSIRDGTPLDNVQAYFDAAHEFCERAARGLL